VRCLTLTASPPLAGSPQKEKIVIYKLVVFLTRTLVTFFFGYKIIGLENIPKDTSAILSSNHSSFWDPPLLGSLTYRRTYYMAKAELFKNKIFAAMISFMGAFPIERKSADKGAMTRALKLLENKDSLLCVFPEGTRNKTGKKAVIFPGAAFLSIRGRAPIVPIAIIEEKKNKKSKSRLPFNSKVTINIGKPMYDYENENITAKEYVNKVMEAIEKLKQ